MSGGNRAHALFEDYMRSTQAGIVIATSCCGDGEASLPVRSEGEASPDVFTG